MRYLLSYCFCYCHSSAVLHRNGKCLSISADNGNSNSATMKIGRKQNFDDSKWDEIFVPANWEDEGYPGYDGYAWYRKHFHVSPELYNKPIYIHLGCIDDVSEVYLNGHFVSFTGAFPPHYITAYNVDQKFIVPKEYWNSFRRQYYRRPRLR